MRFNDPQRSCLFTNVDSIIAWYDLSMQPVSLRPVSSILTMTVNVNAETKKRDGDRILIAKRRSLCLLEIVRSGNKLTMGTGKVI
jgi:hypothetical protein